MLLWRIAASNIVEIMATAPTCSVVEFGTVANNSEKKPPGELNFVYYITDGCGRLSHPCTQ